MQRGGAGEQVEGLEDEADLLVADAGQLIVVELGDVVTVEPVAAAGGRIEATDEVHQGRLAGAGGAHDGDVFVMADAQVDAAEGVDLLIAHLVGLPKILGDDNLAGMGAVGGAGVGVEGIVEFSLWCGLWGHPVLRVVLQGMRERCASALSNCKDKLRIMTTWCPWLWGWCRV